MGYPARLLGDGEEIEFALRPHGKALVRPVLVLLLTCAGAAFVIGVAPDDFRTPLVVGVLLVAAVVLLRWAVAPWLVWLTTNYILTNRRLIMREGVVKREGRDMPLARVNDVSFAHGSLLERMLGCGTLVVESAGEHGQVVLNDLPHVEDVQRELYRLVEEEAARRRREIRDDEYEIDGT
jgi:uncharacterized membrane protein YdbT with pleckstrin-like domain